VLNNRYEDQIMAKRDNIDDKGVVPATVLHGALEQGEPKSEIKTELSNVELTPISPGTEMPANSTNTAKPATEPTEAEAPAIKPIAAVPAIESVAEVAPASVPEARATPTPATPPRFVLKARHKRYALLAASVTFAAALGAVVGAAASGGFSAPMHIDAATVEQNRTMQQSIARLGMEITTLKTSIEQANKSAHTQIANISERLEHAPAEITGSISTPQTTAPLPAPRPVPRLAAVGAQPPARVPVVADWTIHDTRNGYVFVENHGEIYQVQLGAPLPGLGPVQSVKRLDGRWVVLTPKGVILSMGDRRDFGMY
jgi:hypothetical protein